MGREIRRVHQDWEHPKDDTGRLEPLFEEQMPQSEPADHWQMYENTSEGTPISPVMATKEELARWLTDNKASAFAGQSASYDAWMAVCENGHAISAVMTRPGEFVSGAEYLAQHTRDEDEEGHVPAPER